MTHTICHRNHIPVSELWWISIFQDKVLLAAYTVLDESCINLNWKCSRFTSVLLCMSIYDWNKIRKKPEWVRPTNVQLLYRRVHSKWCCDLYVLQSLPQTTNFVRSWMGAERSDCCSWCAFSQLRWNGHPQTPPIFSRNLGRIAHRALNGFAYVTLCVVQMAFCSNAIRFSAHAFFFTLRPSALRTSYNVQPPSCNTCRSKESEKNPEKFTILIKLSTYSLVIYLA